jgi:hypothetical protein
VAVVAAVKEQVLLVGLESAVLEVAHLTIAATLVLQTEAGVAVVVVG